MIPSPNLDDRTFEDIVEEAIRLIPQYCPEWTNHNRSDPGITMIELFAWMMEMVMYRLNKVPQKNYLAFLDLIGVRLKPPQPARVVVTFKLAEHKKLSRIPRLTTLSTLPASDGSVVNFETTDALIVVNNSIMSCFSQYGRKLTDHTTYVNTGLLEGFEPFAGTTHSERFLYIGGDGLQDLSTGNALRVRFETRHDMADELLSLLEWSAWDGTRWIEMDADSAFSDFDSVVLAGRRKMGRLELNGVESFWVRARLALPPSGPEVTEVQAVKASLLTLGEGRLPESLYSEETLDGFQTLDPQRPFHPFGKKPGDESAFYMRSDKAFSHKNADIRMWFELKADAPAPVASEELTLKWEYLAGDKWQPMGQVFPGQGLSKAVGDLKFDDGTLGMTRSGLVSFKIPADMEDGGVNSMKGLWLRCRIIKGDFGLPGEYVLDGDTWIWKEDRPLKPPVLSGLNIRYTEPDLPAQLVMTDNDGVFSDFSDLNQVGQTTFELFQAVEDASPTLYIGFEKPFPNENIQIFFKLRDEITVEPANDADSAEQVIQWEYFAGTQWKNLFAKDETMNLTRSGFISFLGQPDFVKSKRLGKSLYFVRARLQMGGYIQPPMIQQVLLNSVYASNVTTFGETVLGSSEGVPDQEFKILRGPVLPGQEIWVLEKEKPSDREIQQIKEAMGPEAVRKTAEGWLTHWQEVEDLFMSNGRDRRYIKDGSVIRFGDGIHGMIPPKGTKNIRIMRFQTGGGLKGNVVAGSVTVIKKTLPDLEGVTNIFPGEGGADMESLDEVKKRAPYVIRSRQRAVTAEDFEWLGREASTGVARIKAFPCMKREGEVTVVVVPKVDRKAEAFPRPVASSELLNRVKDRLDQAKLVGTRVNVARARYRDLKIAVTVIRQGASDSEAVRQAVEHSIREFLDPLIGGRNHRGWSFGKTLLKLDLYHAIEMVSSVEFVESVTIYDLDTERFVEQIRPGPGELPFVQDVEIVERPLERII